MDILEILGLKKPEEIKEIKPDSGQKPAVQAVQPKRPEPEEIKVREVMPVRVDKFDSLIGRGGLKRGDTILLSGGCGTGKTTFCAQSIYNALVAGEKCTYITFEETPQKIKENMKENFGWDFYKYEKSGAFAIIKLDALEIARAVEAAIAKQRGGLYIDYGEFELPLRLNIPFKPDRVAVDSLSALSITFVENHEGYRQYLRLLFETLDRFNSVNFVIGETEQEPGIYSRTGVEEFLADGVVVLYNIQRNNQREKALEILKLRSSDHVGHIVPYKITSKGIKIVADQEPFSQ